MSNAVAVTREAARRGAWASAAIGAWVPLAAAFSLPTTPLARLTLIAFAALSAIHPASALLIAAGLVAISDLVMGQRWFQAGGMRGPETLVLAFLGGWFLANALARRVTTPAALSLRAAAAVLGAVIVSSIAVAGAGLQAQSTFLTEYLQEFARFAATKYLADPSGYEFVMQGAWLMEGVALMFAVRAVSLRDAAWRDSCVRMLIVGMAAAAALSVGRGVRGLLAQVDKAALWDDIVSGRARLTSHVTDVNAAGSGFVLAALLALGYAAARRRWWFGWLGVLALIVVGMIITASRSAVLAGLLVTLGLSLAAMFNRSRPAFRRTALAGIAGVAIVATAIVLVAPNLMIGERAGKSLMFRWYFTQTSARIISLAPVFGVGLARFRELSTPHMPAPLREVYYAENSHNYVLQVAAELGIFGVVPFVFIVGMPVVRGVRATMRGETDMVSAGIAGAALGFLVTALTGHPFLTPAVTFPFWIVVGLCAADNDRRGADSPPVSIRSQRSIMAGTAIVLVALAVTLPDRTRRERRYVNFGEVAYGVYGWEQNEAGLRYRWTGRYARFFVPANARLVEIPVRALHFDPGQRETAVAVTLDGRPANQLVLGDANWRQLRLLIPPENSGRRYRQIDLDVTPTWSPAKLSPDSGDTRELGVIVGEMKITKAGDPR